MSEPKAVLDVRVLRDSGDDTRLQRVGVVYLGSEQYRVYAPGRASGDLAEWKAQILVRIPNAFGEMTVPEPRRREIIEAIFQELNRGEVRAAREDVGALYAIAQICVQGDVQSSDGAPFDPSAHCTKCGSKCIDCCLSCNAKIRGQMTYSGDRYVRPSFCHVCGRPYPWMEDKLKTAKDLLFHDDQLSVEERKELWDLLQYVMSDPKADLVPAKSKLISIKIQKAAAPIREFVADVLAKYAAEMSKQL